jgi:glutamine synthetase
MHSRYEILLESYCKLTNIEALTMVEMAKKEILPAVSEYSQVLADTVLAKKSVSKALDCSYEREMLSQISTLTAKAYAGVKALENALEQAKAIRDVTELSAWYKDEILVKMSTLRKAADELEGLVSAEYWPIPTYGDLLFEL